MGVPPRPASSGSNPVVSQKPAASRTELLLTGSIVPTLLRLAAPNVLNLLAIVGMVTFDAIFIGRLGADALAGVSLVFPWVMFIQHAAASGMGGGVSSAIARALGAGQRDRANALATHALVLSVVLSAITTAAMLGFGPAFYRAMGGKGRALSAALAYSDVIFSGIIAVWALNIVANIVRGTGNMALPALVLVGAVVAHISLSSALIFGLGPFPALGPAGAGWGLIVSFGFGTLVLLRHLRKPDSLVTLAPSRVALEWKLFAEILKVGVPGILNVGITNLSVVVLTAIAARLGREVAIGYAMGARLEYILIPLAFGFGTAIVAMVGTNWGAKQYTRARRIAWSGGITVAIACGSIGVCAAVFGSAWIGLFTDEPEIRRAGASYLAIVGPAYGFYGLGMALYFATQGLGRVLPTVAANAARALGSVAAAVAGALWLDAGAIGFFGAIAAGFLLYAVLTTCAVLAIETPSAPSHERSEARREHSKIDGMRAPARTSFPLRLVTVMSAFVAFAFAAARDASHAPPATLGARAARNAGLLDRSEAPDDDVLRSRRDRNRNRVWVLTVDSVYVYDSAARTLLSRIALPNWSVADVTYARPPDLVIDMRGVAFVSNNVEPRLVEIDPTSFRVKEHDLRLISARQAETGFASLRFGPDGTLLANAAVGESIFRIDIARGSAEELRSGARANEADVTLRRVRPGGR